MRWRVRHLLICGVVLAIIGGGTPGLSGQAWGGELAAKQLLRYGSAARDIDTLDPHFATTYASLVLMQAMFNSLVRFQPGSVNIEQIEPDVAERWETSEDGLTWTFYLRKGVPFHQGYGELTADDVKFSIERVQDPEVGSPWRSDFANYKAVNAVNNSTVQIQLHRPDPFFLLTLTNYHQGFIVSKKAVEKLGKDFRGNPVGTGPFTFESYSPRDRVILSGHESYFRGKPYLERIEFLFMPDQSSREIALRRGEVDVGDGVIDQQWVQNMRTAGLEVDRWFPGNAVILHFNLTVKPLDDIQVRKALAYAINRQEFIDFFGEDIATPLVTPIPTGFFGYTTEGVEQYDYNPEQAKKLLAEAGYPDGFTLEANMSESGLYLTPMQLIQEQWRRVGVQLELNVVDHPTYHQLIRKDANPVVIYSAFRNPVADIYFSQFYHSKAIVGKPTAITNFSHYGEAIPGVDDRIEKARLELNPEKQKALYAEAQRQMMADVPVYPLMMQAWILARQPYVLFDYIKNNISETMFEGYLLNEKIRIAKH